MGQGWLIDDCDAMPHQNGKRREGKNMEMELEEEEHVDGALTNMWGWNPSIPR